MANKRASQDRKARLAEIQNQQKAKERKVVAGIIIGCLVLLAGLTGVVLYAINDATGSTIEKITVRRLRSMRRSSMRSSVELKPPRGGTARSGTGLVVVVTTGPPRWSAR